MLSLTVCPQNLQHSYDGLQRHDAGGASAYQNVSWQQHEHHELEPGHEPVELSAHEQPSEEYPVDILCCMEQTDVYYNKGAVVRFLATT